MLTPDQKKRIKKGFKLGCTDTLIAKKLGLTQMTVFTYRKQLKITTEEVQKNRYEQWKSLIEAGVAIEAIAKEYDVKVDSIRQALWKTFDFSFVEAKKNKPVDETKVINL